MCHCFRLVDRCELIIRFRPVSSGRTIRLPGRGVGSSLTRESRIDILVPMRRRSFIIALASIAFVVASGHAEENTYQQEGDRLARELSWHEGSAVADIGAGRGELTLIATKRVGASGQVYATELEPKKLALLEALAAKNKNITALKAGESQTNLPPDCCESIFMRLVYHHFPKPA